MKKYIAYILTAAMLLTITMPITAGAYAAGVTNFTAANAYDDGQFTDVPSGAWYAANVKLAYEYGLINGMTNTTFEPSGSLTVAQVIRLAACLNSIYEHGDVNAAVGMDGGAVNQPWYQPYVDYTLKNGIITGQYPNYDAPVSRADFAVIFAAAMPPEALAPINTIADGEIPDVPSNASYAPAVYLLYRAGILAGSDANGAFMPDSNISRAEAAAIVTRMANVSFRRFVTLDGGSPMGASAKLTDTAAFIDLFPIASYDVNGETYIAAEDLTRYGFTAAADTQTGLELTYDADKDFAPMTVPYINRLKTDIAIANASYPLYAGRSVALDGTAVQSYRLGGETLIPFSALSQYGDIMKDDEKNQISFTRRQSGDETGLTGRGVYSVTSTKYYPGNGSRYPYDATDFYSSRYVDGQLNGYCASDIQNNVSGDSRVEGMYVNGVRTGACFECSMNGDYLYGYRVDWAGNYQDGQRVEYVPDADSSPFTAVYTGYRYALLQRADGALYGVGERYDSDYWSYSFPVYMGDSLKSAGWFGNNKPASSEYYLSSTGNFIQRSNQQIIATDVKNVYQYDDATGWTANRTLLLKNDGSLWWCRLNNSDSNMIWNDGLDLSTPVKIMDGVADAAVGGSMAYFAIKTDGSLWFFGGNFYGEKGDGTRDEWDFSTFDELGSVTDSAPVKVMDDVAKVSYGNGSVLALTTGGDLYAWGGNDSAVVTTPTLLADAVLDMGMTANTAYVVKDDGTLWSCDGAGSILTRMTEFYRFADGAVR